MFYIVSVSMGDSQIERVLVIPTEGLPDDREKAVVSSVIHDKESFYQYVIFVLGGDAILSSLETVLEKGRGSLKHRPMAGLPALYERMLQTAAIDPERLGELTFLMKNTLEDGVIPEDFRRMYEAFQKAVKQNG